ncbi:MAG: hypothetical protein AB1630_03595 [bacterium]
MILKLDKDNPEKEREYEISWLFSLTLNERFELMFKKRDETIRLLEANGHRRAFEIVKRK